MANLEQDNFSYDAGFRVITTEEVVEKGTAYVIEEVRRIIGDGPVYLSFDLDVFDPVYVPAVADPELDGLTIREVMKLMNGLRGLQFIGADFVCYCPPLDNPNQITALTISMLMLHIVTFIAENLHAKKMKQT